MSDSQATDLELGSLTPVLPELGTVLAGKYRLTRQLGQGGMGAIYEAEHVKLLQRVAVKFLRPDAVCDEILRERFFREARSLAKIRSTNVCAVFDVDETDTHLPYIVMELLEGRDLARIIREEPQTPLRTRVDWAIQAAEGLAEAHQLGIVHRDVKPANLMLVNQAGRSQVKVVDFGIARELAADTTDLTTGVAIGTPRYMSPEQLAGEKVDPRSDIWSMGIALYNLLSQRMPFEAHDTASLVTAVLTREPTPLPSVLEGTDPRLWNVIAWALRKPIADRPVSMRDWADALRPFGTAATPSSVVVPEAHSRGAGSNTRRNLMASGIAATVVLCAVGMYLAVKTPPVPVTVAAPVVQVPVVVAPAPVVVAPAPTPVVVNEIPARPVAAIEASPTPAPVRVHAVVKAAPKKTAPVVAAPMPTPVVDEPPKPERNPNHL